MAKRVTEIQRLKRARQTGNLPEGMTLRKLFDILDNYSPGCPSEYNLINRCELSCFECWLAALEGVNE